MSNLHFISLGCPKNLVDSEVMLGALIREGFTLTDDPSCADVIVVNTCAFIEDAKKEAIDTILAMAEQKKKGRCRLLIAAGCLPQRYSKEVAGLFPEVDIFIGAGEFSRIAQVIREWEEVQSVHIERPTYLYDHTTPRSAATPPHMAYIKIAEGCFHPCSFCIIPKIRGAFRSREPDSVVQEAIEMLSRGVREINLIAQDSTAYGRDLDTDLEELLVRLAALAGRKWIRILYAYPHELSSGLIGVIREQRDICKYLDMPLQHISDKILSSMRRKEGGAQIRRLLERLRKDIPGVSLRTSLIVGYPGETDADFSELLNFVRESRFEHLGVFVYSPEEGTPAARLPDRVPVRIAEERRAQIMEAQRGISAEINKGMIGKRLCVLVEGPSAETPLLIQARHQGQAPDIDGVVYINEGETHQGEFIDVEITDAHEYDLVGRAV